MRTAVSLKLLRLSEGLSQAALAKKLHVSRSFVCEVENGTKQPGIRFLKRFASALRVPIALLVEDETDPDPGLSAELRRILCEFLAERLGKAKATPKARHGRRAIHDYEENKEELISGAPSLDAPTLAVSENNSTTRYVASLPSQRK